jgi:carbon monoxide dehydrogenase subunit G
MGEVRSSIFVAVPVEEVFAFVADYRNSKRYLMGFTRFEPVGEKTYGLGARVLAAGQVRGMPVHTYLEIVEFEKNRKIVSRSSPSIIGMPTWLFQPEGSGTRVTFVSDFKLPIPVLGRMLQGLQDEVARHVNESLRALKQVVEKDWAARNG